MPTRWNLDRHLRRLGITNALQLAQRAGIGYPAAVRIWKAKDGATLGRFDLRTLDKLAVLFGVAPLSLLTDKPARTSLPAHPSGKPAVRKRR